YPLVALCYLCHPGILSFVFIMLWPPPSSTLFAYTTLFRSQENTCQLGPGGSVLGIRGLGQVFLENLQDQGMRLGLGFLGRNGSSDRKSTRLNSSHEWISYAVFCLKKKNISSARDSARIDST